MKFKNQSIKKLLVIFGISRNGMYIINIDFKKSNLLFFINLDELKNKF